MSDADCTPGREPRSVAASFYYIHGPWRDRMNFCCFICVNYGPYTFLQNDSFFTFIFAVFLRNAKDIQYHTKLVLAAWNKRPPCSNNSSSLLSFTFHSSPEAAVCISVRAKPRNRVNFVEIGQTAAEILRFFDFSRWRPPPSWIFNILNFNGRDAQDGRTAPLCQIWSKSVKPRPRYGAFWIFSSWMLRFFKF